MGVTLTPEMIAGAQLTQQKYGVPASVTLGQIMLESGGSYSGGLSGLAYNYNNLFGLKAGSSWQGRTVTLATNEASGPTTAKFRVYDSIADSIDDHGKLLTKPIYTNKTSSATSLEEYVIGMSSVYATDPNYASELLNIINTNNLTQYDNGVIPLGWLDPLIGGGFASSGNAYEVDNDSGLMDKVLTVIVRILAIILLLVVAVVFFMNAFDISAPHPHKKTTGGGN